MGLQEENGKVCRCSHDIMRIGSKNISKGNEAVLGVDCKCGLVVRIELDLTERLGSLCHFPARWNQRSHNYLIVTSWDSEPHRIQLIHGDDLIPWYSS